MRTRTLLGVVLLLAACGDDDGQTSGGGGSSTAADGPSTTSGSGPVQGTGSGTGEGAGDASASSTGNGSGVGGNDQGGGDVGGSGVGAPLVLFPRTGIDASELGVLVNDADPLSVEIATRYVAARGIPAGNVVHLTLSTSTADAISSAELAPLKSAVDAALDGSDVQALAITWTKPYRVENMSVTSAFSLGFKAIGDTCGDPSSQGGTPNPYDANLASTRPFSELGFRPSMVIPATTVEEAQALIDRGVASDATWPAGSAHLMNTSDQTRSARCILDAGYGWTNECQQFLDAWDPAGSGIPAGIVNADAISSVPDVLFYVQGLASVPDLFTNTYLPGAVGDHLTSYGGQIPTSGQMSAFQFILAGTTGSFGTVVEPCAYQQKFPDPGILIPSYFAGATLVEAYWRSVRWPAEGIFIGEPLARPWSPGYRSEWDAESGTLTIETTAMVPGRTYAIEAADDEDGPFDVVQGGLEVTLHTRSTFVVPDATRAVYRFVASP